MPNLLVHPHEVKVIPGLHDLSVLDPDYRHTGKLDGRLSRSSSHEVSFVLATHGATRRDFVTFSNHVLDKDLNVWEGFAEHFIKRSVATRTFDRVRRILREAVRDAVFIKQLIDHLGASFVQTSPNQR